MAPIEPQEPRETDGTHRPVQYSGIVVVSRPGEHDAVARRVSALPGLEVYARHAASGRLVVVQEAAGVDAHERGLRALQALPGVVTADLVYHVADPDALADGIASPTQGGPTP